MSNWEIIHRRHFADIVLYASKKPGKNQEWLKIEVWDMYYGSGSTKLLEVFWPELTDSARALLSDRDFLKIFRLLELRWVYMAALFKQRCSFEQFWAEDIPNKYRRLAQFMITHSYSNMKYEYNYDYGIPCDVFDFEVFDGTTFPPMRRPEHFQKQKCLLSFSGGKESSTSKLVLNALEIEHDDFKILDRAEVPMLDKASAEEWYEQHPDFQCFLGDCRRIGHFANLTPLCFKHDRDSEGYFYEGRAFQWAISISQRLLAMVYMAAKGYTTLFCGCEYEFHQIYRTNKGVYLPAIFGQSQFFYNYMRRMAHLPFEIHTPMVNFTQGACMTALYEKNQRFNSCLFAHGDMEHWCGECFKCKRVMELAVKLGSTRYKDPLYLEEWLGLNLKNMAPLHSQHILMDDVGSFSPEGSVPVFPAMDKIKRPDSYFNYLHSSYMHDTWDPQTTQDLANYFGLGLVKDSSMDGLWDYRKPE